MSVLTPVLTMSQRSLLLLLWLLTLVGAVGSATAHAATVSEVRRIVSQHGHILSDQRVRLPDPLEASWRQESVRIVYEWSLPDEPSTAPQALWVFRVGAPYRLSLDGRAAVERLPAPPFWSDPSEPPAMGLNGRSPMLFGVPAGSTKVQLELLSLPYMPVGLVEVRQGPVDELTLLHLGRIDRASLSVRVSKIISSTLGLTALLLWLVRPKTILLLLFAGMCGCIALRDGLYGASRLPFPPTIFEQLNPFLILCFAVAAQAATLQLFAKLTARRQRWLAIFWATFSVLFVAADLAQTGAMWLRAMVMLLGNLTLLFIVCQIWVWRQKLESGRAGVLVVGYAVLLLCSLHDLGMVTGVVPASRGTQIPWGFAALVLCYAVITADHVLRQLTLAENAQHVLQERVAQTRRELEQSYRQLAQHEKQSAVRQERSQILRELHDSLGSQLMTAMRGVERDALSKEELLRSLQDGLADLRQLLSTHRTEGRLTEALANWRQHWEDRLSSAGVNTRWLIDESADPVILSPEHLHHVMRILQESATNTLKHAKASVLSIEASADPNRVVLKFSDNGRGMGPADPDARTGSSGQGLIGMRTRAAQMGGVLNVDSGPDCVGTCVTLVLPLTAQGPDRPDPAASEGSAHQTEP